MIVVQGTDVPVEVRVLQRPEQSVIKKNVDSGLQPLLFSSNKAQMIRLFPVGLLYCFNVRRLHMGLVTEMMYVLCQSLRIIYRLIML